MLDASTQAMDGGAVAPVYQPLNPVQCVAFTDPKGRWKNMRYAFRQNLKRLPSLEVPKKSKLAIVAGGPSLNETYKDIPKDCDIMSCGSAHDHVLSLGIKPTYHIECDPTPSQIKMYKSPSDAIYLVASRCDKSMFKHLHDRNVALWHMWESDLGKIPYNGEPAFVCGATVFLAAIPVALTMGYKNFEFFGVDSSFETFEKHHAYPQPENAQVLMVRVGHPETGKEFTTTATWIGQAQQFQEMEQHWGKLFTSKFHGNGMLAEMKRQQLDQNRSVAA